jgi:hypothetical protein
VEYELLFAFICRADDEWIIYVICKGSDEGEEFVKTYKIDKSQITLGNLTTMKSRLGYGSRDYMYYKQRSANDPAAATLNDINYDVDAFRMIESNEAEREVRLLLSKNPVPVRCVSITPIKSKRVSPDHYEEEEEEQSELDAYKDWLAYMHSRKQAMGEL